MSSLLAAGFLDVPSLLSSGGIILLFIIVFAESGLLVGFFLPGDSLLFTAGAVAGGAFLGASGSMETLADVKFNIVVVCVGCAAMAVLGDQVGYLIGKKAGPKIFDRPDSRLFRREWVDSAEEFFAKNGPKALVLARFVPVVRTFVIPLLGYWFGSISWVRENFEIALTGIVLVSFIPMIIEFRHQIAGLLKAIWRKLGPKRAPKSS